MTNTEINANTQKELSPLETLRNEICAAYESGDEKMLYQLTSRMDQLQVTLWQKAS